ncbi:MAG: GlxA family transcriptional regulator [Bacteriovorax sp.]
MKIEIINYPGAMQSAVHGIKEMLLLANKTGNLPPGQRFTINIYDLAYVEQNIDRIQKQRTSKAGQVLIIPPCIEGEYYLSPDQTLKDWILKYHAQGTMICSICAGTFILAATGLLKDRPATSHWGLAPLFLDTYPEIHLDVDKIVINDGDIITAGGLMSWIDLGLELVAQLPNISLMRQLGKYLVVDTASREQRYYQIFTPKLDHRDKEILKVQYYLQAHLKKLITIEALSKLCILTERTFLRRFVKATGLKPTEYLQRLRVQKACELIETTNLSLEGISFKVGYQDTSSFRKVFLKIMGLTPGDFKKKNC